MLTTQNGSGCEGLFYGGSSTYDCVLGSGTLYSDASCQTPTSSLTTDTCHVDGLNSYVIKCP